MVVVGTHATCLLIVVWWLQSNRLAANIYCFAPQTQRQPRILDPTLGPFWPPGRHDCGAGYRDWSHGAAPGASEFHLLDPANGWLIGWLDGWLVGWLVGCLVGWLVDWLVARQVRRL